MFVGDIDVLFDLFVICGILLFYYWDEVVGVNCFECYLVEVVLLFYLAVLGLSIKDSQFWDWYGVVVLVVVCNG